MTQNLRIHPSLVIAARKHNLGGAIRLYSLAKNVAPHGWIYTKDLKPLAYACGVAKSSYYNWLTDAKAAELFHVSTDKHGRELLTLASYPDAYTTFEVAFIDRQAVEIPASVLFSDGWYTFVWEGWNHANFNGKVISQDTKQRLTGLPAATQRRLDRKAKIRRIRNYVVTDAPAANLDLWKEHSGKPGVFRVGDRIAYCIPSISVVDNPTALPVGSKRLRRNISARLKPYSLPGAGDDNATRLFCETELQAKRAEGGYCFEEHKGGYNLWRMI